MGALADLHTKISGVRPPWDPILWFSHVFSQKVPTSKVHAFPPPVTGPRTTMRHPGSASEESGNIILTDNQALPPYKPLTGDNAVWGLQR